MTTFEATHSETTSRSTAVDALTYNANKQELVIDWHDDLYKYSGVPLNVYESLLSGTYKNSPEHASVGRSASKFKRDFGKGEYLGRVGDVTFVDVSDATPVNVGVEAPESETFSLTPVPDAPSSGTTYTVDFEVDGVAKEYEPKGVTSVDEAIAALEELFEMLDVEGTVTGVYVDLA